MKRVLLPGVVSLLLGLSTLGSPSFSRGQDREDAAARGRFVGAWRLVWMEEPAADGKVHRADCTGMFVFTREGRASVQVMYRSPEPGTPGGPVQYAQGGYEASFGRYEVDEAAHTFTYHVEGALVRSLVGKDLVRSFELSGGQMIVRSSNPNEKWRVAWEHY